MEYDKLKRHSRGYTVKAKILIGGLLFPAFWFSSLPVSLPLLAASQPNQNELPAIDNPHRHLNDFGNLTLESSLHSPSEALQNFTVKDGVINFERTIAMNEVYGTLPDELVGVDLSNWDALDEATRAAVHALPYQVTKNKTETEDVWLGPEPLKLLLVYAKFMVEHLVTVMQDHLSVGEELWIDDPRYGDAIRDRREQAGVFGERLATYAYPRQVDGEDRFPHMYTRLQKLGLYYSGDDTAAFENVSTGWRQISVLRDTLYLAARLSEYDQLIAQASPDSLINDPTEGRSYRDHLRYEQWGLLMEGGHARVLASPLTESQLRELSERPNIRKDLFLQTLEAVNSFRRSTHFGLDEPTLYEVIVSLAYYHYWRIQSVRRFPSVASLVEDVEVVEVVDWWIDQLEKEELDRLGLSREQNTQQLENSSGDENSQSTASAEIEDLGALYPAQGDFVTGGALDMVRDLLFIGWDNSFNRMQATIEALCWRKDPHSVLRNLRVFWSLDREGAAQIELDKPANEPSNVRKMLEHYIDLVPIFAESPVLRSMVQASYGISVHKQELMLGFLSDYHQTYYNQVWQDARNRRARILFAGATDFLVTFVTKWPFLLLVSFITQVVIEAQIFMADYFNALGSLPFLRYSLAYNAASYNFVDFDPEQLKQQELTIKNASNNLNYLMYVMGGTVTLSFGVIAWNRYNARLNTKGELLDPPSPEQLYFRTGRPIRFQDSETFFAQLARRRVKYNRAGSAMQFLSRNFPEAAFEARRRWQLFQDKGQELINLYQRRHELKAEQGAILRQLTTTSDAQLDAHLLDINRQLDVLDREVEQWVVQFRRDWPEVDQHLYLKRYNDEHVDDKLRGTYADFLERTFQHCTAKNIGGQRFQGGILDRVDNEGRWVREHLWDRGARSNPEDAFAEVHLYPLLPKALRIEQGDGVTQLSFAETVGLDRLELFGETVPVSRPILRHRALIIEALQQPGFSRFLGDSQYYGEMAEVLRTIEERQRARRIFPQLWREKRINNAFRKWLTEQRRRALLATPEGARATSHWGVNQFRRGLYRNLGFTQDEAQIIRDMMREYGYDVSQVHREMVIHSSGEAADLVKWANNARRREEVFRFIRQVRTGDWSLPFGSMIDSTPVLSQEFGLGRLARRTPIVRRIRNVRLGEFVNGYGTNAGEWSLGLDNFRVWPMRQPLNVTRWLERRRLSGVFGITRPESRIIRAWKGPISKLPNLLRRFSVVTAKGVKGLAWDIPKGAFQVTQGIFEAGARPVLQLIWQDGSLAGDFGKFAAADLWFSTTADWAARDFTAEGLYPALENSAIGILQSFILGGSFRGSLSGQTSKRITAMVSFTMGGATIYLREAIHQGNLGWVFDEDAADELSGITSRQRRSIVWHQTFSQVKNPPVNAVKDSIDNVFVRHKAEGGVLEQFMRVFGGGRNGGNGYNTQGSGLNAALNMGVIGGDRAVSGFIGGFYSQDMGFPDRIATWATNSFQGEGEPEALVFLDFDAIVNPADFFNSDFDEGTFRTFIIDSPDGFIPYYDIERYMEYSSEQIEEMAQIELGDLVQPTGPSAELAERIDRLGGDESAVNMTVALLEDLQNSFPEAASAELELNDNVHIPSRRRVLEGDPVADIDASLTNVETEWENYVHTVLMRDPLFPLVATAEVRIYRPTTSGGRVLERAYILANAGGNVDAPIFKFEQGLTNLGVQFGYFDDRFSEDITTFAGDIEIISRRYYDRSPTGDRSLDEFFGAFQQCMMKGDQRTNNETLNSALFDTKVIRRSFVPYLDDNDEIQWELNELLFLTDIPEEEADVPDLTRLAITFANVPELPLCD